MEEYKIEIFCFDAGICEEDYSWVELPDLGLPVEMLYKMAELGIIEIQKNRVRTDQVNRVFKALRLRRTLGVNLSATGIILDLLERMEELYYEIEQLRQSSRDR